MFENLIEYLTKSVKNVYTKNNLDENIIRQLFKSNNDYLLRCMLSNLSRRDMRFILIDNIELPFKVYMYQYDNNLIGILKYYKVFRNEYKKISNVLVIKSFIETYLEIENPNYLIKDTYDFDMELQGMLYSLINFEN